MLYDDEVMEKQALRAVEAAEKNYSIAEERYYIFRKYLNNIINVRNDLQKFIDSLSVEDSFEESCNSSISSDELQIIQADTKRLLEVANELHEKYQLFAIGSSHMFSEARSAREAAKSDLESKRVKRCKKRNCAKPVYQGEGQYCGEHRDAGVAGLFKGFKR